MLNLQLPEDIEDRLDLLSLRSGHTRQYYVLEAVLEYLDDVEARQEARERNDLLAGCGEPVAEATASAEQAKGKSPEKIGRDGGI